MSVPQSRPARKTKPPPDRGVFLVFSPVLGNPGVFQVTDRTPGRESVADYWFLPIEADHNGLGYKVERLGADPAEGPFEVYLDAENGLEGQHACGCREHRTQGRCVHCSALLALHQSGQL
jgi:hypothetical protein